MDLKGRAKSTRVLSFSKPKKMATLAFFMGSFSTLISFIILYVKLPGFDKAIWIDCFLGATSFPNRSRHLPIPSFQLVFNESFYDSQYFLRSDDGKAPLGHIFTIHYDQKRTYKGEVLFAFPSVKTCL